ncbi:MAG: hypothetical protein CMD75_03630 [Gammaproteobacteria bacterium]|nr:hypothetical protein [Gammaproteobacteria bacterium]
MYQKEIDLKFIILICLLLVHSIHASISNELDNFFNSDLKFIQTSLNQNKNSFDESEGIFKRLTNNDINVEVVSPFREKYILTKEYIEIHDLEFDQIKKITKEEYKNNLFISYLINGFDEQNITRTDQNVFVIDDGNEKYQFKYVNKNTLQVRFKDNMDVTNIIKFYK